MKSAFSSVILIVSAMLSIQFGASVAKQLFPVAGAAGTTALRVFFAAVILSFVCQLWKFSWNWRQVPDLALYGLSLGFMNILFYFSLERIPLGIAVALEFTGPLAVALFSSRKIVDWVWVLLAGLGIYLILPTTSLGAELDPTGILLALMAGFFWALYIIFGKRAGRYGKSLHVTSVGMWFAALVAVPFGIYFNGPELQNISLIPMGIVIAVLSSALPYSLEMVSLSRLPTKTFGILMSLEPVVAASMGFMVLGETLHWTRIFAILCIMAASAGSTATARRGEPLASTPLSQEI